MNAIFPQSMSACLDDDESLGKLEALGDEVSFIQAVRSEQFRKCRFHFLRFRRASTRKSWKGARDAGTDIIDFSAALEDEPGATCARWDRARTRTDPSTRVTTRTVHDRASRSCTLALLLLRARKTAMVRRPVATVFEPASEHGQKGMDELHQQTVNLLSFQPLPKDVFDAQVAFNMLARYGPNTQPRHWIPSRAASSATTERSREMAPDISLLLAQAPIFHGYALAFRWRSTIGRSQHFHAVLVGDHVTLRFRRRRPSNVTPPDNRIFFCRSKATPRNRTVFGCGPHRQSANQRHCAVECAESMAAARPDRQDSMTAFTRRGGCCEHHHEPCHSERGQRPGEESAVLMLPALLAAASCGYHTAGHGATPGQR